MAFTNTLNQLKESDILCLKSKEIENPEDDKNIEVAENPIKKPKKKKKKRKYKSVRRMMKEIMKPKSRKETKEIHKEKIMKTMGGGSFSKIDKI